MSKEHPIEAGWLRFRKKHDEFLKIAEKSFESKWEETYPGSDTSMIAGLPMPVIESLHAIFSNGMDMKQSYRTIVGDLGGPERMDFLQNASAFLAYRADKRIIRIDHRLFESLKNTRFPDKFLISNLVLPARSVVLTLDGHSKSIVAFFDMSGPMSGEPEMVFKLSEYDHNTEEFYVRLALVIKKDETLQQSIDAHIKWIMVRQKEMEAIRSEDVGYLSLIGEEKIEATYLNSYTKMVRDSLVEVNGYLNCILYSIGNKDIVTAVSNRKPLNNSVDTKKMRDFGHQTHSVVGSEYGRTIQRFLDEEKKKAADSNVGGGKSKKPHIRSGHSHIYWKNHPTQKGKKIQIVHYLPPNPIGMGWGKETKDVTDTKLK